MTESIYFTPKKSIYSMKITALILFLSFSFLIAQEGKIITTDTLKTESGKFSIIGYPFAFYTPETDVAVGAGAMATFRLDKIKFIQTSNIKVSAWYSKTNQYSLSIIPYIYFPGTRHYYLEGEIKYSKEKLKYYGIGNTTPEIENAAYSINRIKYYGEVVSKGIFIPKLKTGFVMELSKTSIYDTENHPYLSHGDVQGDEGGKNTGFGFVWLYDRRNYIFYPTKNGYYKFLINFYGRALGGIYTYNNYILDMRHFFDMGKEHIVAVQFYGNFTDGNPPFFSMPALGGDKHMRGYFKGRYIDKQFMTAQIEYRKIVWWRLGVVAFFAVGDVSNSIGKFNIREFKNAYGFGLRFVFNQKQRINLRMDMGFGHNTNGVYFSLEEAF